MLAGGGAYAASKIGPKDTGKNAIRAKHVKKNAVRTPKIANGAVGRSKLAQAARLPNVVVRRADSAVATFPTVTVPCNPGECALAGGGWAHAADAHLMASRPSPPDAGVTPTGWQVVSYHRDGAAHLLTGYVICATP